MRKSSSIRSFLIPFFLLLGTIVFGSGIVAAQDVPKGKLITVHLSGSARNGNLRISKVLPSAKGICRGKANKKDDCEDEAAWALKGSNLPDKWTVTIEKKSQQPDCFTASSFTLYNTNTKNNPVPTGPVQDPPCATYSVWAYNLTLKDESGQTVGAVVDPLIVIDYSGP